MIHPEDNCFADGGNMTSRMQTISTDPEKAKRQIAEVGKTPRDFGWDGEPVKLPVAAGDRS
jgi:hypothetical protein